MKVSKEKYNTIGVIVAIGFVFISLGALSNYQDLLDQREVILIGGFAFFGFFVIHIASQILSGYSWKNLAPWNNGIRKSDSPRKFWTEILLEFIFASAILILCGLSVAYKWYQ